MLDNVLRLFFRCNVSILDSDEGRWYVCSFFSIFNPYGGAVLFFLINFVVESICGIQWGVVFEQFFASFPYNRLLMARY